MFENLKKHLSKCAAGYVQIMVILLNDVDSSIKCNNASNLELVIKTYISVIEALMSFIGDKAVRDAFCQNIERSKCSQADLASGRLDVKTLNLFFMQAFNRLNDSINNWQCDNSKPICAPESIAPPLINVQSLNGLELP